MQFSLFESLLGIDLDVSGLKGSHELIEINIIVLHMCSKPLISVSVVY